MPRFVGSSGSVGSGPTDDYAPNHKWRFAEMSGTSLVDSVGAVQLTASGSPTLAAGTVPDTVTGDLAAVQPNYILFDGVNDKAQSAAAPTGLTAYGFLFAAWFYNVAGDASVPFAYGTAANGWAWQYNLTSGWLIMNRSGVGAVGNTGASSVPTATWTRVACWCPAAGVSAGMRLYINGVLKTVCTTFAPSTNAADILSLGCGVGDTNFSNSRIARPLTVPVAVAATADLIAAADWAGQSAGFIYP